MHQQTSPHSVHSPRNLLGPDTAPSIERTALWLAQLVSTLGVDPAVGQPSRAIAVGSYPLSPRTARDLDFEVQGMTREFLGRSLKALEGAVTSLPEGGQVVLQKVDLTRGGDDGIIRPGVPGHLGNAHVVAWVTLDDGTKVNFSVPHRITPQTNRYDLRSVQEDPQLSFIDASRRRTFSHEALGFDPISRQLLDPHTGAAALSVRELRVLDPECFRVDPLNGYRAIGQMVKLGLKPDHRTSLVLSEMASQPLDFDAAKVQEPRLRYERSRMFALGSPSIALNAAVSLGFATRDFPELAAIAQPTNEQGAASDRWLALLRDVDEAFDVAKAQSAWSEQEKIALISGRLAYHVALHEGREPLDLSPSSTAARVVASWCYDEAWSANLQLERSLKSARDLVGASE